MLDESRHQILGKIDNHTPTSYYIGDPFSKAVLVRFSAQTVEGLQKAIQAKGIPRYSSRVAKIKCTNGHSR